MITVRYRCVISLLLIGLAIFQATYYYPRLPGTVASHFGASGVPNGWMSKGSFLGFGVGTAVFVSVLTSGVAWAVRSFAQSTSRNQPSVEVQEPANPTGGERVGKEAREAISGFTFWLGAVTVVLLLAIFQLAIQANFNSPPVLEGAWIVLGLYLAVVLVMGVRMSARLREMSPPSTLASDIWFPAKRFGWGWGPPVRWQGWVFIAGWTIALVSVSVCIERFQWPVAWFWSFLIMMVVLLVAVCAIKGEKPRWRWGE